MQLDDVGLTWQISQHEANQDEPTYMSEFSKDVRLPLNHFIARIKLGLDHLDCEEVPRRPLEALVHGCERPVSKSGKGVSAEHSTKRSKRTP